MFLIGTVATHRFSIDLYCPMHCLVSAFEHDSRVVLTGDERSRQTVSVPSCRLHHGGRRINRQQCAVRQTPLLFAFLHIILIVREIAKMVIHVPLLMLLLMLLLFLVVVCFVLVEWLLNIVQQNDDFRRWTSSNATMDHGVGIIQRLVEQ